MRNPVLSLYLTARKPRNFLKLVIVFIVASATAHWLRGYDSDWGLTNLIFSTEATIAGAVMLMFQEEAAERADRMLARLVEMNEAQAKTLKGVLLIAEAQRDALLELQGKQSGNSGS
jgi:uncharacterized membrane protein